MVCSSSNNSVFNNSGGETAKGKDERTDAETWSRRSVGDNYCYYGSLRVINILQE